MPYSHAWKTQEVIPDVLPYIPVEVVENMVRVDQHPRRGRNRDGRW